MDINDIINNNYDDLNNLTNLLRNYIEIYRLLVSSTSELNNTSIIKKSELKHANERINAIGELIDKLLKVIKKCGISYCQYCSIKDDALPVEKVKESIYDTIHNELKYHDAKIEQKK